LVRVRDARRLTRAPSNLATFDLCAETMFWAVENPSPSISKCLDGGFVSYMFVSLLIDSLILGIQYEQEPRLQTSIPGNRRHGQLDPPNAPHSGDGAAVPGHPIPTGSRLHRPAPASEAVQTIRLAPVGPTPGPGLSRTRWARRRVPTWPSVAAQGGLGDGDGLRAA
jgi:hypothetical protein